MAVNHSTFCHANADFLIAGFWWFLEHDDIVIAVGSQIHGLDCAG
jgi:hypothetical protein